MRQADSGARSAATPTRGDAITTDALVIGAGPVGLFQVFELGLLDIRAHVIDALPHVGGQPVQLYPDKPIYDIPALPACTGQALADALQQQCAPFQPVFHLGQTVKQLQSRAEGGFDVETDRGTRFVTRAIFIAAGVGAFEPRRLKLDGLAGFEGSQVHYHRSLAGSLQDRHVLIIGDDEQALSTALQLAQDERPRPRSVTLMHRRESFRANEALVQRLRDGISTGQLRFIAGQLGGVRVHEGHIVAAQIHLPDGREQCEPLDTLLVLQGLSPRLGPISDWGLAMDRKQLVVDTETFSTSVPGVFAVGDINTYPGKRKLIVCGFHECTLAAYAAAALVYPDRPVQLQYTSSNSQLHALLGVRG